MSKNVLMLVGGLALIVVIIFWVQSTLVKTLQQQAAIPIETPPGMQQTAPGATAPAGTQPGAQPAAQATATTTTKKTTITKPVHKHK